jgi:hypothetical protein
MKLTTLYFRDHNNYSNFGVKDFSVDINKPHSPLDVLKSFDWSAQFSKYDKVAFLHKITESECGGDSVESTPCAFIISNARKAGSACALFVYNEQTTFVGVFYAHLAAYEAACSILNLELFQSDFAYLPFSHFEKDQQPLVNNSYKAYPKIENSSSSIRFELSTKTVDN